MHRLVQRCRERSNLTPKQLSKLLNISTHTYWAMEQGKITFRPEILEMLARIYGIQWPVSDISQEVILNSIATEFGMLNEDERFLQAMKNLTGEDNRKLSFRKIERVKNEILLKLNEDRKSAP